MYNKIKAIFLFFLISFSGSACFGCEIRLNAFMKFLSLICPCCKKNKKINPALKRKKACSSIVTTKCFKGSSSRLPEVERNFVPQGALSPKKERDVRAQNLVNSIISKGLERRKRFDENLDMKRRLEKKHQEQEEFNNFVEANVIKTPHSSGAFNFELSSNNLAVPGSLEDVVDSCGFETQDSDCQFNTEIQSIYLQ